MFIYPLILAPGENVNKYGPKNKSRFKQITPCFQYSTNAILTYTEGRQQASGMPVMSEFETPLHVHCTVADTYSRGATPG